MKDKGTESKLTGTSTGTTGGAPPIGSLAIDASALKGFLVDLPEGETQGMRREQDGIDVVVQEITSNQNEWGGAAGVTADEVSRVVTATERLAQLRAYRPAVAKLLEMIDETEAQLEDTRDTVLRSIAESVDAKAKTAGPGLLAKYEQTRAYRSAVGRKAARTRQKQAADKPADPTKPG